MNKIKDNVLLFKNAFIKEWNNTGWFNDPLKKHFFKKDYKGVDIKGLHGTSIKTLGKSLETKVITNPGKRIYFDCNPKTVTYFALMRAYYDKSTPIVIEVATSGECSKNDPKTEPGLVSHYTYIKEGPEPIYITRVFDLRYPKEYIGQHPDCISTVPEELHNKGKLRGIKRVKICWNAAKSAVNTNNNK